MRKQHDTIPQLSLTKAAYATSRQGTEEEMEYSVSQTAGGKLLFCSKGKLAKPYDDAPSDFSTLLVNSTNEGRCESASDPGERTSKKPYSLGDLTVYFR